MKEKNVKLDQLHDHKHKTKNITKVINSDIYQTKECFIPRI